VRNTDSTVSTVAPPPNFPATSASGVEAPKPLVPPPVSVPAGRAVPQIPQTALPEQ
jgi:hypothetical protein